MENIIIWSLIIFVINYLFPEQTKKTLWCLWKMGVWAYNLNTKVKFSIIYVSGIVFFWFGCISNTFTFFSADVEETITGIMIFDGLFLWSFSIVFVQEVLGIPIISEPSLFKREKEQKK